MRTQTETDRGPGARILLAEDDADVRAAVAAALREDHHVVVEACDGGRLLVHIGMAYSEGRSRAAFDLLISDVRMPVCSGMQILEELRRAGWTTPTILMSAFIDPLTITRGRSLGAVVLRKPVEIDELRSAVRDLLRVTCVTGG